MVKLKAVVESVKNMLATVVIDDFDILIPVSRLPKGAKDGSRLQISIALDGVEADRKALEREHAEWWERTGKDDPATNFTYSEKVWLAARGLE